MVSQRIITQRRSGAKMHCRGGLVAELLRRSRPGMSSEYAVAAGSAICHLQKPGMAL
jgi:hypothetical protein